MAINGHIHIHTFKNLLHLISRKYVQYYRKTNSPMSIFFCLSSSISKIFDSFSLICTAATHSRVKKVRHNYIWRCEETLYSLDLFGCIVYLHSSHQTFENMKKISVLLTSFLNPSECCLNTGGVCACKFQITQSQSHCENPKFLII